MNIMELSMDNLDLDINDKLDSLSHYFEMDNMQYYITIDNVNNENNENNENNNEFI